MPGGPVYGELKVSGGAKAYPNNDDKSLLGIAAKGNIVIGDYTSTYFKNNVLPNLRPKSISPSSKVQPYVVDPTDANLGYETSAAINCSGKIPCFDGNYDQRDKDGLLPGVKTDGTARKFYESTLKDATFKSYLSMPAAGGTLTIDATLYTNHALAGYYPGSVVVNGAMVSRDDGLVRTGALTVNHDIRLSTTTTSRTAKEIGLPLSLQRPRLTSWQECPSSGC